MEPLYPGLHTHYQDLSSPLSQRLYHFQWRYQLKLYLYRSSFFGTSTKIRQKINKLHNDSPKANVSSRPSFNTLNLDFQKHTQTITQLDAKSENFYKGSSIWNCHTNFICAKQNPLLNSLNIISQFSISVATQNNVLHRVPSC